MTGGDRKGPASLEAVHVAAQLLLLLGRPERELLDPGFVELRLDRSAKLLENPRHVPDVLLLASSKRVDEVLHTVLTPSSERRQEGGFDPRPDSLELFEHRWRRESGRGVPEGRVDLSHGKTREASLPDQASRANHLFV
jgi:hypothetical protein